MCMLWFNFILNSTYLYFDFVLNLLVLKIQQQGTAMGKHMAPPNANLFMGQLEKKALENYPQKPHLWLRHIDGI